jgi:hypothetical protein
MSLHCNANSSLCRRPVEAARSTIVRSRSPRLASNSLISAGVSTVGTVRRVAPCRTKVIGLLSKNSYRQAWLKRTENRFLIFAQLLLASGSRRSHNSTAIGLTSQSGIVPQMWNNPPVEVNAICVLCRIAAPVVFSSQLALFEMITHFGNCHAAGVFSRMI